MQKFFSNFRWVGAQRLLSVLFFLCCTLWAMGQGSVTIKKLEFTHKTSCRDNGTITMTVNKNPTDLKVIFQLLLKDNGSKKDQNETGHFEGLEADTYILKVLDGKNPSLAYIEQEVTIEDKYVPLNITGLQGTITIGCEDFAAGVKVKIDRTKIQGGIEPFEYLLHKTQNDDFNDAGLTYQAGTEFTVTSTGEYRLRVKDNCGTQGTIPVHIDKNFPPVRLKSGVEFKGGNCNQVTLKNVTLFSRANNADVSPLFLGPGKQGVKVVLYAANAAGKKMNDEVLFNKIITEPNSPEYIVKTSSTGKYWGEVTTPCGDVWKGVVDMTTEKMKFTLRAKSVGCTGEPGSGMTVSHTRFSPSVLPMTVKVFKVIDEKDPSKDELVQTLRFEEGDQDKLYNFSTNVLDFGTYRFVGEVDGCPDLNPDPALVRNPKALNDAGKPIFGEVTLLDVCSGKDLFTSQEGTTSVQVSLKGYLPDEEKSTATIIAGPSNVGVTVRPWEGRYRWFNMKPGDYTVRFTVAACDNYQVDYSFNIKPDDPRILFHKIESTAVSNCGAKGYITTEANTNNLGARLKAIELLNDKKEKIAESVDGLFRNLDPGTYYTRLRMGACSYKIGGIEYPQVYYVEYPKPLVILPPEGPPTFIKAQGVACDNLSGETKGAIYLYLPEASDVSLTYRKKGVTEWTTLEYKPYQKIPADPGTYEFQLKRCGNVATKRVLVNQLTIMQQEDAKHPCVDQPYTISVPLYDDAQYEWKKKDNPTVLSSEHKIDFAKYTAADDGTYICRVQWGGCVTREVKYTLNSNKCGTALNNKISGKVFDDRNELTGGIDGTPIGKAGSRRLYIHLLLKDTNDNYVHTNVIKPVADDGTFTIGGLDEKADCRLILSTEDTAVEESTRIPGWKFVGETYDTPSHDGTPNGVLDVKLNSADITTIKFGIKRSRILRSNRHITTKL